MTDFYFILKDPESCYFAFLSHYIQTHFNLRMKATVAITLTAGLPVALASAMLKPRIIGPDEPTDRFKFVVSIQDSEKAHYCGGMLLDSTTVLTASHCFSNTSDAGFVVAGKTV